MPFEEQRTCTVCGAPFVATGRAKHKATCGPECSDAQARANAAAKTAKRRAEPFEARKECKVCGTPFVARGSASNKATCGPDCSKELARRRSREHAAKRYVKRENTRPMIVCPECGTTFQPVRDRQKWCGTLCRRKGSDKAKPHRLAPRVCMKCGVEVERKPGKPVCDDCKVDKWERDRLIEHRRRLRTYGITQEQYEAMLEAQGGLCAICGTTDPGRKGWAIDHDHDTNHVRGLLCMGCNTALGQFQDDPAVIAKALAYLKAARRSDPARST